MEKRVSRGLVGSTQCYGVFTEETDYWFSGFVSVCYALAREKVDALKAANVPCEFVEAIQDEAIDHYRM
jgi:hypothetical protein